MGGRRQDGTKESLTPRLRRGKEAEHLGFVRKAPEEIACPPFQFIVIEPVRVHRNQLDLAKPGLAKGSPVAAKVGPRLLDPEGQLLRRVALEHLLLILSCSQARLVHGDEPAAGPQHSKDAAE